MKKGNMKILTSVFIIASIMFSIGLGTMAYFNDVRVAGGNTFTAGNLDVKLYDGADYVDGPIAGFWSTPSNWAPGETYTRRLYFKNFGNVPVQVALLDFKNYDSTVSGFWNVIEVVSVYEHYEGDQVNYAPYMAEWSTMGNSLAPLTLKELMSTANVAGAVANCDAILFATSPGGCTDPECTATSFSLMGGDYLAPQQQGWLELGFKFSSSAGSTYEEAECTFDLQISFIQGPTSGVCRHELPGFIPNPP